MRIVLLPGDGIGPEVVEQAVAVLRETAARSSRKIDFDEHAFGGAALDAEGVPFPPATREACLAADAVLLGAVGLPKYDKNPPALKPETGLLGLRKALEAFANLRPAVVHKPLVSASTLKAEVVEGTDILIIRELTGGIYFGTPRGFETDEQGRESAVNTMRYRVDEIERVTRVAFDCAMGRRKSVVSVDKANVLETSQLWRKTVEQVARDYPEVNLDHMYVDNCSMQLIAQPRRFDVVLTENLFGDILSDEAAMLTGSIGMLPSASIGNRVGIFEPVHGTAPDIAGKDIANPLATIASAAMLLRHAFGWEEEAQRVELAIASVLEAGFRTADIFRGDGKLVGTRAMGEAVLSAMRPGS
ncbi:MAG: 3-isopropylmalate dehydrogenase [Acidobacteria bacterium]|nr:3-isopropylmalate dehydrogenase [Acidobacteriota bacterium]